MQELLDEGGNSLTDASTGNWTLLMRAIAIEIAALLIERGAKIYIRDDWPNYTALDKVCLVLSLISAVGA